MRSEQSTTFEGTESDLEDVITVVEVAEAVGARPSLVARLVRTGILDVVRTEAGEPLLQRRAVLRLRRMQRLRRDLGVNFAGACVIVDLVEQLDGLGRELSALRAAQTPATRRRR